MDLYSNEYQENSGSDIAAWAGGGTPAAAACFNLIKAQGVSAVKPVSGQTYCVSTAQGNIAVITVQRLTVDGSGDITSTRVQAAVWSDG